MPHWRLPASPTTNIKCVQLCVSQHTLSLAVAIAEKGDSYCDYRRSFPRTLAIEGKYPSFRIASTSAADSLSPYCLISTVMLDATGISSLLPLGTKSDPIKKIEYKSASISRCAISISLTNFSCARQSSLSYHSEVEKSKCPTENPRRLSTWRGSLHQMWTTGCTKTRSR